MKIENIENVFFVIVPFFIGRIASLVTDIQEWLKNSSVTQNVIDCKCVRQACAESFGKFPIPSKWAREDGGFDSRYAYVIKDAELYTGSGVVVMGNRFVAESVGDHYSATCAALGWRMGHLFVKLIGRIKRLPVNEFGYTYVPYTGYFHFVMESLVQLLYSLDVSPDATVLYDAAHYHGYYKDYLDMLVRRGKIKKMMPVNHRLYRVNKLTLTAAEVDSGMFCRATVDMLRKTFCSGTMPPPPTRRIFITRKGRRQFDNQSELEALARTNDIEVIDTDGMSVEDQIMLFSSASLIIANHGAGLTNLLYTQPNTRVVELFSPRWLNDCYYRLSSLVKSQYRCIVADKGTMWGAIDAGQFVACTKF